MDLALLDTLTLSVSALRLLDRCPRLFRYVYLDRLIWPPGLAAEAEESLRQGQIFHRLVELFARGRSIETQLRAVAPEVQSWWQTFLRSPHAQPQAPIHSEIPLWTQVDGIGIQAQLDRLSVTEEAIEIWDWKTDRLRPQDLDLHQDRQTQLYPLMVYLLRDHLSKVTSFTPGVIRITFWYANHPDRPFQRTYDREQLQQNHRQLRQEIESLRQLHEEDYPMTQDTRTCMGCRFRARCYGLVPTGLDPQQWEELGRSSLALAWEDPEG